ncbi:WD40 repeat domain-containing protein [Streptomyces sp. NPDC014746]|uniref:WD40 repeat domain-containing protein n=1 Tax=Streptomyces sp. NPDC014746 TaxID=3364904 RepID=UPI0036F98CE6
MADSTRSEPAPEPEEEPYTPGSSGPDGPDGLEEPDPQDGSPEYQRFLELTGTRRSWLRVLADAVHGDPSSLDELLAEDGPAAEAFACDRRWPPAGAVDADPLADEVSVSLRTAETLLGLARALTLEGPGAPDTAREAVRAAAAHWRAAGVLTPATAPDPTDVGSEPRRLPSAVRRTLTGTGTVAEPFGGPLPDTLRGGPDGAHRVDEEAPPGTAAVLAALDGLTDRPAAAFVEMLVHELAGRPVRGRAQMRHKRNEAVVQVLMARGSVGFRGELRLRQLPSGPHGLHPDPASMSFLVSPDGRLAQSLSAAWRASGAESRGGCVLWSVTEESPGGSGRTPCNDIRGGSLGAAFGVALLDLPAGRPGIRLRLPRVMRENTAVTGAIGPAGELHGIGRLGPKLKAARRDSTVVLPEPDRSDALEAAPGTGVRTTFARNVREAYRKTYRTAWRPLVTIGLVLVTVLGAGAIVLRGQWNSDRERALSASRTLAAAGSALGDSDPVRRTLLAAAALDTADTPEAREAARTVLTARGRALLPGAGSWAGFSPDGRQLLALGRDRRVLTWDVRTARRTRTMSDRVFRSSEGTAPEEGTPVAVSPDLRTLATSDEDGEVLLWDPSSGAEPRGPLQTGESEPAALAFSPDGRLLATAPGVRGATSMESPLAEVRVWDARTGALLRSIRTDHTAPVRAVAFSPDGTLLATAAGPANLDGTRGDPRVRMWRVADGHGSGPVLEGMSSHATVLAFSPDGARLAAGGGDGTLRIWRTGDGRDLTGPFGTHEGGVSALAWNPSSELLASAAAAAPQVKLWTDAGTDTRLALAAHSGPVAHLAWSPDGRTLATGAPLETGRTGAVRLWDLDDATGPGIVFPLDPAARPASLAFAPKGDRYAAAGWDGVVRIGALERGVAVPRSLAGPASAATGVGFTRDGLRVVTAWADGSVSLRSTDGKEVWRRQERTPLSALAHATDGPVLVAGNTRGELLVWDDADGPTAGAPRTLAAHDGRVTTVAVDGPGDRAASAGVDGTVRLWDTASGRQRWSTLLTDPRRAGDRTPVAATSLALDGPGQRLAVGGADGAVRVWKLGTDGLPASGAAPAQLYGPFRAVTALAWRGKDAELAAADSMGLLTQWNADTGRLQSIMATGDDADDGAPFDGSRALNALAYSPDGSRLVTMGADLVLEAHSLGKAGPSEEADHLWNTLTQPKTLFLSPQTPGGTLVSVREAVKATDLQGGGDGLPLTQAVDVWDGPAHRLLRTFLMAVPEPETPEPPTGTPAGPGTAFHVSGGPRPGTGTLTVFDAGGRLSEWNLATGRQTGRSRALGPAQEGRAAGTGAEGAWFSPDGRLLAVAEREDERTLLTVHSTADGRAVTPPVTLPVRPVATMFSPDGSLLAAVGRLAGAEDSPVQLGLWRTSDGHRLWASGPLPDDCGTTAFSGDGRTLSTACPDGVRRWDVSDPSRPTGAQKPSGSTDMATVGVAVSPDGTLLAAVTGTAIRLVTAEDDTRLVSFPHSSALGTSFSPDGRQLVSASSDGGIRSWDTSRFRAPLADRLCERLGRPVGPEEWKASMPIGFSGGYRELCAKSASPGAPTPSPSHPSSRPGPPSAAPTASADPPRALPRARPVTPSRAHQSLTTRSAVSWTAFSGDGGSLVAALEDGTLASWDAATGRARTAPDTRGRPIGLVDVDLTGSALVGAGVNDDDSVRVWDLRRGGAPRATVRPGSGVGAIAVSAHGSVFALGLDTGRIVVHRASDGKLLSSVGRPESRPGQDDGSDVRLALSPDGSLLALADVHGTVRTYRTSDGAPRAEYPGHTAALTSLQFSGDGALLVSGGSDGRARVWRLADGSPVVLAAGKGGTQVSAVGLTPDGHRAVTLTSDGLGQVWDTTTGRGREALGGVAQGTALDVRVCQDGAAALTLGTYDMPGGENTASWSAALWDLAAADRSVPLTTLAGPSGGELSPDGGGLRGLTVSRDCTSAALVRNLHTTEVEVYRLLPTTAP